MADGDGGVMRPAYSRLECGLLVVVLAVMGCAYGWLLLAGAWR